MNRPRPVLAAVAKTAPVTAFVPLLTGPGYLGALSTAGVPVGRWDILVAIGLSAIPIVVQFVAAAWAVRTAERDTTPVGSPRDDRGRILRPSDARLIDLLEDMLDHVDPQPAQRPEPTMPDPPRSQPGGDSSRHVLRGQQQPDPYAQWYGPAH